MGSLYDSDSLWIAEGWMSPSPSSPQPLSSISVTSAKLPSIIIINSSSSSSPYRRFELGIRTEKLMPAMSQSNPL
eukprot:389365-Pelagomonas_calceolata.AAC.4